MKRILILCLLGIFACLGIVCVKQNTDRSTLSDAIMLAGGSGGGRLISPSTESAEEEKV